MRVLAVDGSKIALPKHPSTQQEFGVINYANQHSKIENDYCNGVASILYDVLNNIVIDSQLTHAKAYEGNLAIEHINYTKEGDLLIFDRNYPSYIFTSYLISKKLNFVIRCSKSSFKTARNMLKGLGESNQHIVLTPHHKRTKEVKEKHLLEQFNRGYIIY